MKFNDCQFIHSNGESKLHVKSFFQFRSFIHQSKKPDNILRNIQAKKTFHSIENQHFNFINVGFFLIGQV